MDANYRLQNSELVEEPALGAGLESSSGAIAKALSPMSVPFTPVIYERSVFTELGEPIAHGASPASSKLAANIDQKRLVSWNEKSIEKKPKMATGRGHHTSMKPFPITPAKTSTPFHSREVTKPASNVQSQNLMKNHETHLLLGCARDVFHHQGGTQAQGFTTTIQQLTQTASNSSGPQFPHSGNYDYMVASADSRGCSGPTGIFNSQKTGKGPAKYETTVSSSTLVGSSNQIFFRNSGDVSVETTGVIYNTGISDQLSESSDAYPLDTDIEDGDIIQLLTGIPGPAEENHIPPSSVQGWDLESRSAAEYDPGLNYSPPDLNQPNTNKSPEDLLDEDVDWDTVVLNTDSFRIDNFQRDPSNDSFTGPETPRLGDVNMHIMKPSDSGYALSEEGPFTPFLRPPFPEKVRDRPFVPGVSCDTLLRICFRVGEMISQTVHCFNHKQDVVFELYARVTYSSRETSVRKQHFQFTDLYKDQQPYPTAMLTNWRVGGERDKESSVFLDTSDGPRICLCMCKPVRDPKAAVGWTFIVLSIKEINREQVHWAKRIIGADSREQSSGTVVSDL